jgi:hypothetical protein
VQALFVRSRSDPNAQNEEVFVEHLGADSLKFDEPLIYDNAMIQDVQTAKRALERALELMEGAHKMLMESIELVRTNCSDEEYKAYRGGMSHVVGRLFFLLMEPIYRQHPSLTPPDTPREFVEAWAKKKFPEELKPDPE